MKNYLTAKRSALVLATVVAVSVGEQTTPALASEYCPVIVAGDQDCSGSVTGADIIFLVNYVFRSGQEPCPDYSAANADCEGDVGLRDIVVLVSYVFRGGPSPCDVCSALFADTEHEREAEMMAMWLSGELHAPPLLKARIYYDLQRIRSEFGALSYWIGEITYFPWHYPSRITLAVDSMTASSIEDGTYHAWDSLNALYKLATHDDLCFGNVCFEYLRFEGMVNPTVLASYYRNLPGVSSAFESIPLGDYSNVYPLIAGDTITYLIRHGDGDCPAGCIESEFWYMGATFEQIWLIGYRAFGQAPPDWWSEAQRNWDRWSED